MPLRQIPAAAGLIQSLWRCYAADKSFYSKVPHTQALTTEHKTTPAHPPGHMEDPP